MKKIICALGLLMLLTLSGCQNSGGETAGQQFESLGASFEDGKTVTVDMNREEVLEEMGGEPDDWTAKYGLIAYYGAQSPYEVTSLQYVGQEEMPFSTSLGVDMGDSADDIKEALGEPASESADRYSYGLERGEDGYTLFPGTEEAFYQYAGGEGDPYNLYMANFTLEDGKVTEFSVYVLRE